MINDSNKHSGDDMLSVVLPAECHRTKVIRNARFRVAHITRDLDGNYAEKIGWLMTDIVCDDPERVCIYYEHSKVFLDVPASEIVILRCIEQDIQKSVE